MCGRYSVKKLDQQLFTRRYTAFQFPELEDRLDVRPTTLVLVATKPGPAELMRWGLLPAWGENEKAKPQPINAKAETVAESKMFGRLLKGRRCLIFASSFYEWQPRPGEKKKQKMEISTGAPMAFAGLWDIWHPNKEAVKSCTIITNAANELVKTVHDRMPVILEPEQAMTWLNPEATVEQLQALMTPRVPDGMSVVPVPDPSPEPAAEA